MRNISKTALMMKARFLQHQLMMVMLLLMRMATLQLMRTLAVARMLNSWHCLVELEHWML